MESNKALENTIAKGIVKGSLIITLISIVSSIIFALIISSKTTDISDTTK